MNVFKNVSQLISNTPIVELCSVKKSLELYANIFAKVEFFNPTGSVKDRAALFMIEDAEKKNLINKETAIIEPTSGNTGIGLAALCASKGYKLTLTMSESMSIERQKLIKAYGANIVLTEASKGMSGAIEKAKELLLENANSFMPSQFTNSANAQAHRETTGPEIWNAMDGNIDIFIAGIGTGGTITGTGEYLQSKKKNIEIIGVEPASSPFFSEGKVGSHGLQGIGAGFEPEIFNKKICSSFMAVTENEAYKGARLLATTEGLLVGISSGAALSAAIALSKKIENKDKNIVVILPDTGERYLSTDLFTQGD